MKLPTTLYTTRDTVARQGYTVPAGSGIHVTAELKRSYRGVWGSMHGSYTVTLPKGAFTKTPPSGTVATHVASADPEAASKPYLHSTSYIVEDRRPEQRRYSHAGSGDLPFVRRLSLALIAQGRQTQILKQDVMRCVIT